MPQSDVAQGVLPRIIATLVNRRRQVKGLMKDKSATPAQLQQVRVYVEGLQELMISTTSDNKLSSSLPTRCTVVLVSRDLDSPLGRSRH